MQAVPAAARLAELPGLPCSGMIGERRAPSVAEENAMFRFSWSPSRRIWALCCALGLPLLATADAGVAASVSVAPESAAVESHLALARHAADAHWQDAYQDLCPNGPRRHNESSDKPIAPQMIFDNVAILGDVSTAVYVLKTSRGWIMIDSSYQSKTESLLLPSLHQLGIDPTSIRYLLITHGHPDHFGGAKYFQDHYGTRVAASSADAALMAAPPGGQSFGSEPWPPTPKIEVPLGDGDTISLGDTTVRAIHVPGHTPGSLGFIFPVLDHGRRRMAGLFGGLVLVESRASDSNLHQYIDSLAHFAAATRKQQVDVELENHIIFDGTLDKLQLLRTQQRAGTNPFVVGQGPYQNFLTVLSECAQTWLARREPAAH